MFRGGGANGRLPSEGDAATTRVCGRPAELQSNSHALRRGRGGVGRRVGNDAGGPHWPPPSREATAEPDEGRGRADTKGRSCRRARHHAHGGVTAAMSRGPRRDRQGERLNSPVRGADCAHTAAVIPAATARGGRFSRSHCAQQVTLRHVSRNEHGGPHISTSASATRMPAGSVALETGCRPP